MRALYLASALALFGLSAAAVLWTDDEDSATARVGAPLCQMTLKQGQLFVDGALWLNLGKPCLRRNGKNWCFDGKSGSAEHSSGRDGIGSYESTSVGVDVEWDKRRWELTYKRYQDDSTIVFEQHYPDGMEGTDFPGASPKESADKGTASWFPAFRVPDSNHSGDQLGVLIYKGTFAGQYYHVGPIESGFSKLRTAMDSGPMAVFSNKCAVILSSSSAFMASSSVYDSEKAELGFGVLGSVPSILKGYRTAVIASSSPLRGAPDGIRRAFHDWGAKLISLYGTKRTSDVTLVNLQFSTDNGAYYYYNTGGKGINYQDAMIKVFKDARKAGIPFRQWLMDSWWYFKEQGGSGLQNWTARPDIFPDGIQAVTRATKWDIVAHNRWFAASTDYAKQNGGDYDFVIEAEERGPDTTHGMALPLEQRFWDDLFAEAKLWGLRTYEQDWLYNQFRGLNHTLKSVHNARTWLLQMGHAAQNAGLNVQYCMSWPRHVLQTLEVDAVSQVRASDDYQPNNDNWSPMGVTSMMLGALKLTPSKDNFWSSPLDQGTKRYGGHVETAPRLHAMVSTLSTGPVAPSDRVDLLDADLILKSCTSGGRLLRPDLPAVNTDDSLLAKAGIPTQSNQKDMVWSTFSSLGGFRYSLILAARSPSFEITEKDLYHDNTAQEYVGWNVDKPFRPQTLPVTIPQTDKTQPVLTSVAPVFPNGWALLGEAESKWVPVSGDRFQDLRLLTDGFVVRVTGEPGEQVKIWFRTPQQLFRNALCKIPPEGVTYFHSSTIGCPRSPPNSYLSSLLNLSQEL